VLCRIVQGSAPETLEKGPASCKAVFAELSNYLDEQLDDSLCGKMEQHLEGCEPCRAFLASLESTIAQLRSAPSASLAKTSAAKIRREILRLQFKNGFFASQ
jgi:anti-sigma factor RsiW